MKKKVYSAKDIIVIKPDKMVVDAVDLTKGGFRDHLNAAVDGAVKFATTLVTNDLSGAITYFIQLSSSYEDTKLQEGEYVYQEPEGLTHEYTNVSDVVELLWRDGKVPEWINVFVSGVSNNRVNITLECCGRFTDKPELVYHSEKGMEPFQIMGPPIPENSDWVATRKKFSL